MYCPKCGKKTKVYHSVTDQFTNILRRKRRCDACGHRFTTFEYPDAGMRREHEKKV